MEDEPSLKGELRQTPLLTDKGYTHRRTVIWTQMQRTFKAMQKQIQILDTLTKPEGCGDPENVNTENETLRRLYQDIIDGNNQIASCIKRDDPSEAEQEEDNKLG